MQQQVSTGGNVSELAVLVVGACVALGIFLAYRAKVDAQRLTTFAHLAQTQSGGGHSQRQPDLDYAAEGFMGVALLRRGKTDHDLHHFAAGSADLMMTEKGCSPYQALSAHWGGICAIVTDDELFQLGLDSYDATVKELGRLPDGVAGLSAIEQFRFKCRQVSKMQIGTHLALNPGGFDQFLRMNGV